MTRIRTMITAVVGTAAAAGAAITLAAAGNASAGTPTTGSFTVRLHQTSDTSIDLGKKGFSAGDEELGAGTLTRNGQRVGWANLSCTTARAGRSTEDQLCEFVLRFGTAQLTAAGSVRAGQQGPGTFTLAILGGTGRYRGASGQLAITSTSGTTAPINVSLDN